MDFNTGLTNEQYILEKAKLLIKQAAILDVVLTIEQKPLLPLAMGNAESVATVRRVRVKSVIFGAESL